MHTMPHTPDAAPLPPEDLVAIHEAVRLTGLEKATLYRLARRGRIRAFRVLGRALRFERADLLGLVRAQ